jgi:hypothetical protein
MVLRRVGIGAAAGRNRAGQRRIRRVAGVDAEREECLAVAPRVADRAARETMKSGQGKDPSSRFVTPGQAKSG